MSWPHAVLPQRCLSVGLGFSLIPFLQAGPRPSRGFFALKSQKETQARSAGHSERGGLGASQMRVVHHFHSLYTDTERLIPVFMLCPVSLLPPQTRSASLWFGCANHSPQCRLCSCPGDAVQSRRWVLTPACQDPAAWCRRSWPAGGTRLSVREKGLQNGPCSCTVPPSVMSKGSHRCGGNFTGGCKVASSARASAPRQNGAVPPRRCL